MNTFNLHHGNSITELKQYPDNHFDSVVTDPPYLIGFLGKGWDSPDNNLTPVFEECLRVLKPGGHLLSFSAARTYHRLAVQIEEAGFEIRDQLMWLYASGFPKAQDIGKAIQKKIGVEDAKYHTPRIGGNQDKPAEANKQVVCTSPEAKKWEGWKTALKPAHEPLVWAQKKISVEHSLLHSSITETNTILGDLIWQFANSVRKCLPLTEVQEVDFAQINAVAYLNKLKLNELLGQTDTHNLSETVNLYLSIDKLWKNILDAHLQHENMYTTLTALKMTTEYKTLQYWILQNIQESITQVQLKNEDKLLNVRNVTQKLQNLLQNLSDTQMEIIAQENAMLSQVEESQTVSNAEKSLALQKATTENIAQQNATTREKNDHEPIVMARKPFKGSCINNVQEYGTGALNIEATRIQSGAEPRYPSNVIGETDEVTQKYFYSPKVSRGERHIGFDEYECDDLTEEEITECQLYVNAENREG